MTSPDPNEPATRRPGSPAAEGTPIFSVRDLAKSFGDLVVLDGVDFDLRAGECLVVLGRSGSGKSVMLRHLNGLETPDRGEVIFEGTDLAKLSEYDLFPIRRRVAMLFQQGALFDSMNVLENVAFPLREHTDLPDEEITARVAEKLRTVRLEGIEEKMPSDLSGGMRKRVALARSLALDPDAVLFDEPTTGLDPMTSATIGRLIRRIQSKLGVTPVVVTHDIALARTVGDRVAFLFDGRFRFLGTWQEANATEDDLFAAFLAGREEVDDAA